MLRDRGFAKAPEGLAAANRVLPTVGRKAGMLITRFNRFCAKHGKVALIAIAVVIIFPFVFLSRTPTRGSGQRRTGEPVGRMYGKKIPHAAFLQQMHATELSIFLLSGGRILLSQDKRHFDGWVNRTLERMRSLREARERGLGGVSDEEVAERIRSQPLFQKDGAFDKGIFTRFVQSFLRERNMAGPDFDERVREDIIIGRLEESVVAGAFVAPQEVRARFDRDKEKLAILRADFSLQSYSKEGDADPPDEKINEYFAANQDELRLPDEKRIRVVELEQKTFADDVEITEDEIKEYYGANPARYEKKDKKLEAVRAQIESLLRQKKARPMLLDAAKDIRAKIADAIEAEKEAVPGDVFTRICKELEIETKDSGPFTLDGEIPNFGTRRRLQQAAYRLTADDPISAPIREAASQFIACWLETIPGGKPEELVKPIRKEIVKRLKEEEARAFFMERIEPFREELAGGKTPEKLKEEYAEKTDAMSDKDDEEKAALRKEFGERADTYLRPYFEKEQKQVRVAIFSPDSFRDEAEKEITPEDMQDYYDENEETYKQEEVRVRQILLRVPPKATDEQKRMARGRMDGIRKRIEGGEDFSAIASKESQDYATRMKGGDLGYFPRGEKSPPFDDAAFALEVGEVSPVVDTARELYLLKLEDKRSDRTFDEVKSEVKEELLKARADRLAGRAAADFADDVYEAAEEKASDKTAADVFGEIAEKKIAEKMEITVKDTDWFGEGAVYIRPIGSERDLAQRAYSLGPIRPVSDVIRGSKDVYVACWLQTEAAHLPEFSDEPRQPPPEQSQDQSEEDLKDARKRAKQAYQRLLASVQRHIGREKSLEVARQKAEEAYDSVKAALDEGKEFSEARGEHKFEEVEEFPRDQPPRRGADNRLVVEHVVSHPANTLLPPIETPLGAVVVYLKSRTPPDDEEFEEAKEQYTQSLLTEKRRAVLSAFHKKLEKQSETELSERWQPRG